MRPPGRVPFAADNVRAQKPSSIVAEGTFIEDFTRVVKTKSPQDIEDWLMANARKMSEGMFLDPRNTWDCEPYQMLFLRAFAPEGVFTDEARDGFLSQVRNNPDLVELADALFGDDQDITDYLPDHLSAFEDMLIESVEKAYRAGIRRES